MACVHRLALPPITGTPSCVVDVAVVIGLSFLAAHASVVAVVAPRREHDFANAHIGTPVLRLALLTVIVDYGVAHRCVLRPPLSMFYYLLVIVCVFLSYLLSFVSLYPRVE